MIAVTGATGQLGQLVIKHLLNKIEPEQIVALVRSLDKAAPLTSLGVQVRQADYSKPETLESALDGVAKLLLISSSEVGQRAIQHQNVINAAKQAGVELLGYTSLLHADTSPLALAEDHVVTEAYLKQADVPHVLLRNGWYTENYLASVAPAVANGGFIGCAKDGKISSAAREDYAEAAAAVLTSEESQSGKVYELSGDDAYTLSELSELISEKSGKAIPYINMEEADFAKALEGAGLPGPFAAILANSDSGAANGALYDDSHTLSSLIGHPTKSLEQLIDGYL
ncbi:SDR family oxidoreductase [Vibrio sp. EA2]|uniref:SDR family oxidoreductase n=1 Tax=Vibrio sp. EA2 TaxID=3079860 RepID=UPI002948FD3C|nr:SDR family oxidoreductase [Vibrio sp. EA2]MDV6250081.1 SDR family oxidoreductase [Vibrio sp. EA2]